MIKTLSLSGERKRISGLVLEISTPKKNGSAAEIIIADALFPAETMPPAAGTRLITEYDGKVFCGTVIRAEKTDANSSFVRMEITAVQRGPA